jgi:CBS domain-containing protein
MRLTEALRPEHVVVPLEAETIRDAVLALVDRLQATGAVSRPELLEKLASDERIRDVIHVGDRVLLPHLRTEAVDRLVVALGVTPRPLRPVPGSEPGEERIVVLVLAPPAAANVYLQMVGALARLLRSDAVVDRLTAAASAEEVLAMTEVAELALQPRLTVRDLMTQRVFRVYPDTPVHEVIDLLVRHGLKSVPVIGDKREVLGVVSDRDLLRHLLPTMLRTGSGQNERDEIRALGETPVREIMTRSVMCISEDQGLADVASTMVNKDVDRVPVVFEGRLTGFLTRADIIRRLFGQ